MQNSRQQLQIAIAAIEAQRSSLGDAVVDAALGPMREQLAQLQSASSHAVATTDTLPTQKLKQVSVLFLDIVGSTNLSQHLDPEDVHALVDGVLELSTRVVHSHGGRVLQYAGDNLLAVFGADQTQEDDAERAVRCGLALLQEGRAYEQRVLQQHGHADCNVRVGIHTGPVLLGGGVDDEGNIRGLTVNIAARMEQTAPPGGLRISHDTWLPVRGVFDVLEQAPLQVKGRDEPLVTYLVQRAKPRAFRIAARGIEDVATPLVGRDAEMEQLVALLHATAADRTLHAATIIGDPGLGKSRLMRELQSALEVHAQRFWLLLGRAQPQSRLQPYGLLRDLLAWRLQIADSDSGEVAKVKLVDGLSPWLAAAGTATSAQAQAQAQAQAHSLGQLIGLDFSGSPHLANLRPQQLREQGFDALHCYLRGLAREGPAVAVLLEDLQWADDGSLDFVAELMEQSVPLLLLANARPELLERRPTWGEGVGSHLRLELAPLDSAQGQTLSAALLQRLRGDAQFDAVRALLEREAEGNPFYMEELVRMLRDDGVIAQHGQPGGEVWRVVADKLAVVHLPSTLVGVLQARLDTLSAANRLALQQASIVGPVFWDAALAALNVQAPQAIPTLEAKALIQGHAGSTFEGTSEHAFSHHLLQQVTYDTVLKAVRRSGHAAAAAWLAERVADRPSEYLAITAEHYERAGDHERAFEYFERASTDADRRCANHAALEYVERALASPAASDPRRRAKALLRKCSVADVLGLRTLQQAVLEEREAVARRLEDHWMLADVLFGQALLASRRSDETRSLALAKQAAEMAQDSGNNAVAAHALGQIAWAKHTQGHNLEALADAREGLRRIRRALDDSTVEQRHLIEVQMLTLVAMMERAAGMPRQARATLEEGLGAAERHGFRRCMASIFELLAGLALDSGRLAEAIAHSEDCLRVAHEIGAPIMVATAHLNLASCKLELGQLDEAARHVAECEMLAVQCEDREKHGRCLVLRGRLAALTGGLDGGAYFEQARSVLEACALPSPLCQTHAHLARWHLERGDLAQARRHVDLVSTALESGISMSADDEPLFPLLVCHQVWTATGDPRASSALQAAYAGMQQVASASDDEASWRRTQGGVALYREIAAAWSKQGIGRPL